MGSSWPRDGTWVPWIAGRFFTIWAIREVLVCSGKSSTCGSQLYCGLADLQPGTCHFSVLPRPSPMSVVHAFQEQYDCSRPPITYHPGPQWIIYSEEAQSRRNLLQVWEQRKTSFYRDEFPDFSHPTARSSSAQSLGSMLHWFPPFVYKVPRYMCQGLKKP